MDPSVVSDLSAQSRRLVEKLVQDPEEILKNLYQYQAGTSAQSFPYNLLNLEVVRSPYLSINHQVIACLAGQPTEQPIQQIKDSPTAICLHRKVKPLDEQGKQAQTLLVTVGVEQTNPKGKIRYERVNYVVKIIQVDRPYIKLMKPPGNIPKWISQAILQKWLPNVLNCQWVELDQYTTETLFLQIGTVLQRQQGPTLNGLINHIGSTLLSKSEGQRQFDGIILLEYASWGSLESFLDSPLNPYLEEKIFYDENGQIRQQKIWKTDGLLGLIKQLMANLSQLQEYLQFCHTDLKCRNVVISDQVSRVNDYRGLKWFTTFTLKIIDLSLASIILQTERGPLRLIHHNSLISMGNYIHNPIEFHFIERREPLSDQIDSEQSDDPWYRLSGHFLNILGYIRHAGITGFYSFDLYTFLVDLYSHDQIFYTIMSNPELKAKIWDCLWFPEEEMIMYDRVRKLQSTGKFFYDLIDTLREVKLRPNLMEILWRNLSESSI